MLGAAVTLTTRMREVGSRAVQDLCADRSWRLVAHNVRTTHVHVVANCRGVISPERAMTDFKARITRELRSEGIVATNARLWARHGSTLWLNTERGLAGAIVYTNEWQHGPNAELKEEQKRELRERMESLSVWMREQGLPENGKTVVVGESLEERRRRVNEPRTQEAVRHPLRPC